MYGQRRCGVTEVVRSDRQAQCSRSRIEAVAAEIAVTQRRGVRGGETRSEGAGLSGPSSSPTPTAALKITLCEKPSCISDARSTTSPPMRGTNPSMTTATPAPARDLWI